MVHLLLSNILLWHSDRSALDKLDRRSNRRRVLKNRSNLFEVSSHGSGEEKVHRDENAGCNGGVDDVIPPANVVDGYWGDHDNNKVPTDLLILVNGS